MIKFDYEDIRDNVADELITEFGAVASLKDADTEVLTPVTCVLLNYTPRERDSGQLIGANDMKALISAKNLAVEPDSEKHQLVADGITWRIISVAKVRPAGPTVMYKMQVRQ